MTGPLHTYGPTCLLADDDPNPSSWHSLDHPPRPRPQFFYVSSLPIDDPLSSLPPPASGQAVDERVPPQPFSVRDNIALEDTWLSIKREQKLKQLRRLKARDEEISQTTGLAVPGREGRAEGRGGRGRGNHPTRRSATVSGSQTLPERPASRVGEDYGKLRFKGGSKRSSDPSSESILGENTSIGGSLYRKRETSPNATSRSVRQKLSEAGNDDPSSEGSVGSHGRSRDASISGSPFARVPATQPPSPLSRSVESSITGKEGSQELRSDQTAGQSYSASKPSGLRTSTYQDSLDESSDTDNDADDKGISKIPVGVSRLHLVELPNLKVLHRFSCTSTYMA